MKFKPLTYGGKNMHRNRAYRRFMMKKAKQHVSKLMKNVWLVPESDITVNEVGKLSHQR